MAAIETPMYEHDCDDCTFLGRGNGKELYDGVEVVDLYYCPNSWEHGSYVMRTGNDGPEYHSGPLENSTGWGPNDEIYKRARERGLVEEIEPSWRVWLRPGDPIDFSQPFSVRIGG